MGVGGDAGRAAHDRHDGEAAPSRPSLPLESQAPNGRERWPDRQVQAALRDGNLRGSRLGGRAAKLDVITTDFVELLRAVHFCFLRWNKHLLLAAYVIGWFVFEDKSLCLISVVTNLGAFLFGG